MLYINGFISTSSTNHDGYREQRVEVRLDVEVIKSVDGFKYLGSTITVDGSEEREVTRRIQVGWKNWRDVSGKLGGRMPVKLKGKVYKTAVRPTMMDGTKATPIKKVNEKRLDVAEMKIYVEVVVWSDQKRQTRIRGTVKVGEVSKKVQEAKLRWYGHVLRRDEDGVDRKMVDMEVLGRRGRGRPMTRWNDCIAADVRDKQLDIGIVHNRND